MVEFLDLNDDCLEHIFNYCDVREQLVLKKVSPRFDYIFERKWRNTHTIVSYENEHYKTAMLDKKSFLGIVPLVNDFAVELSFNTAEQLRCAATRFWPKVRFVTGIFLREQLNDDDAELRTKDINFARIFPALERIQLKWTLDERDYGNKWRSVKCLLPFNTIDNSSSFSLFQSYEYTSLALRMILKHNGRGLHTLSYNFVSNWCEGLQELRSLPDLKRLNFCGHVDSVENLETLLNGLPRLQQVHYRSERFDAKGTEANQVRDFINLCKNAVKPRPKTKLRTTPLHLHCYAARSTCEMLKQEIAHSDYLRIFFVDSGLSGNTWPFYYKLSFQCEWDVSKKNKALQRM